LGAGLRQEAGALQARKHVGEEGPDFHALASLSRVRRGVPLVVFSVLTVLFAAAAAPRPSELLRVDARLLGSAPKPRLPARAAVDWCGTGQPTTVDRKPDVDLSSPRQVHVTYAIPADGVDQLATFGSRIATDASAMDVWWRREDPTRTLRFDLFAFPGCTAKAGRLDIGFVRLPRAGSSYLDDIGADRLMADLGQLGSLTNLKHLVYYDGPSVFDNNVCGTAFVPRSATTTGGLAGIAFVWMKSLCGGDIGASGLNAAVAVHELIHGLGSLQGVNAPNECPPPDDGHTCDSTTDVLYPSANSQTTISGQTLDAGRNDYYGHSLPGFDVQDSGWLTRLPQQRLSVTVQTTGTRTGVVRLVSPTSFECARSCTLELDRGLAATLVAAPRAGARFLHWTGACTGSGSCRVTLDSARTVTAVFGVTTFRLTTSVGGQGKISSTPGGVSCPRRCSAAFKADSSIRLRAAALPGFRFAGWTGSCRGTRPCIVKLNRDRTVRAMFRRR
jgi:Divergent InlB B-repeat domain